jgi:hypothetical protein
MRKWLDLCLITEDWPAVHGEGCALQHLKHCNLTGSMTSDQQDLEVLSSFSASFQITITLFINHRHLETPGGMRIVGWHNIVILKPESATMP